MNKKRVLLIILCLQIILCSNTIALASNNSVLPSGISYSEIGEEIEAYVKEHEKTTAGMAVSVFGGDGIIYENYFGYGDIENKLPVDKDTVIEWGSVTKLLVWVSLMQLWEDGKVDFNEDINSYLPSGYLGKLKYDNPITINNLFNHEAGFQDYLVGLFTLKDTNDKSLGESLKEVQPPQIYPPGYATAYSNWSTSLGAHIVENVSQMSFSNYVHQNIFSPLDMNDTAVFTDLSDNKSVKERRVLLKNYSTKNDLLEGVAYNIELYPSGMATSTLSDFRKFGTEFLQNERKASKLFKNKETLDMMLTPTKYYGDTGIGLNYHGLWAHHFKVETLGHGGNTAGSSSFFVFDPKSQVGVVVMTNQLSETKYNKDMLDLVFGKFEDSENSKLLEKPKYVLYEWTRTIEEGPYKFLKIMGYRPIGQGDVDKFWIREIVDGQERITQTHWALLKVPTGEGIFIIITLLSFIIGVLYSAIILLKKFFNI